MSVDNLQQVLKNLEQAKIDWQQKQSFLESELVVVANSVQKFELRARIKECQTEINQKDCEIKSLKAEIESAKIHIQSNGSNVSQPYTPQSITSTIEDLSTNPDNNNSNLKAEKIVEMTKITWLHLSDWHQKGEDFGRDVVRDKLIADIKNRAEINPDLATIDFIVFSGDLANSGNPQEYKAAQEYLLDPLLEITNLSSNQLFFVPGNHDFNRSKSKLLPAGVQNPFQSDTDLNNCLTDPEYLDAMLQPFKSYREFISQYNNQHQPDYGSTEILEIGDLKIGLLGLNSALMTARNKDHNNKIADQGFLVVGEPQVHTSLQLIKDCDVKIAILHHPFDWLTEFDRRRIKSRLGEGCHFILCGHEHLSRVERVIGTDGDYVFIPAGASYDRPDYPNSYNFVQLNLEQGNGNVFLRKWSRDRTKWIKNEDSADNGQFPIALLPKQLKSIFAPK